MPDPLVSVMISTHNRAGYLREAAASVLAQTFTGFELILCDDASSDETPAVCLELERSDRRVRTLRHEQNVGMVQNWNSGLTASRGHYFCKLDDDNRYLETFLEKTVQALQETPDAAFAFTDEWRIDAAGNRDKHTTEEASHHYQRATLAGGICKDTALLAVQQAPGINAALFDLEVLIKAGGCRELAGNFADFDVFLNLAAQGYQAAYVPERLVEYRQHEQQDSGTYLKSITKANLTITILKASQFEGEAEQLRREKLAQAYVTLSRVMLLNRDVQAARAAIQNALQLTPANARTRIVAGGLNLPVPLIEYGLRLRYGKQLDRIAS